MPMKTSLPVFLVVAATFAGAACTAPTESGEEIGTAQQAWGPGIGNGLDGACTWPLTTLQSLGIMADLPLTAFPSNGLPIADECRQTVLSHVLECALTGTQTVYDAYSSAS